MGTHGALPALPRSGRTGVPAASAAGVDPTTYPQFPCELPLENCHSRFEQLFDVLAKVDGKWYSTGRGPKQKAPFKPAFADQEAQSCCWQKMLLTFCTGILTDDIALTDETCMLPHQS